MESLIHLYVDRAVPVAHLYKPFKKVACAIDNDKIRRGVQSSHRILVYMIPVCVPCSDSSELYRMMEVLLKKNGCRTLWDFEALTLNMCRPDLQMRTPFVTHRLAFGVPENSLYIGPDRDSHGHELWSLEKYAERGTPRHLRIAATPMTDVDSGILSGWVIEDVLKSAWKYHGHRV